VAEIFTVTQRGRGKPDYSKEISLGRQRPGLTLKYGQTLKIFGAAFSALPSAFAWVKPLLAIGATEHLVDWETGLDMPVTVPKGYTLTAVQGSYGYSQDAIIRLYLDTVFTISFGVPPGGFSVYVAEIMGWATSLIDPTAAASHLYDIRITNQGGATLEGAGSLITILEAVGTKPLPTTKTVKCKFCGHEWTVPKTITLVKCPECGQENIYADLSGFKGTP